MMELHRFQSANKRVLDSELARFSPSSATRTSKGFNPLISASWIQSAVHQESFALARKFQSANKRVLDSESQVPRYRGWYSPPFQSANKRVLDSEANKAGGRATQTYKFQSANKRVLDSESA